jgi:hypothetical protein
MLGQVSASKIGTVEPFLLNPSTQVSREARLAARLGKLISKPFPNPIAPALGAHSEQTSTHEPSLELLLEIIPENVACASSKMLVQIVNTLRHLRRTREALANKPGQDYLDQMNWGALLPIYTNLDSPNLADRIFEAHQLALEARLISVLDVVLENELFDLIANDNWKKHDPKNSLKSTLDICIFEVAINTPLPEKTLLSAKRHDQPLGDTMRQSYWQLANQLNSGSVHLHVPTNLVVGKVSWQRIREHWNQLNASFRSGTMPAIQSSALPTSQISPNTGQHKPTEIVVERAGDDVIEIRSSGDPMLAENLGIQLEVCRDEGRSLTLAVFQRVGDSKQAAISSSHGFENWHHSLLELIGNSVQGASSRGFFTAAGELALVFEDLERSEATLAMRGLIDKVEASQQPLNKFVETKKLGIVCGLACVETPSKRFRIEQLIEASWRCLSAAKNQGAGTVKSIEAY